jgi:tachykinin receptor 3
MNDLTSLDWQIVKMMIAVVVIFAACWLPQHVYYFVINRYPEILYYSWTQPLYLAIYWLAMSNAMYNPIIYCWMNAR